MDVVGHGLVLGADVETERMPLVAVAVLHGDELFGIGEAFKVGIGEDMHDSWVVLSDCMGELEGGIHGGYAHDMNGVWWDDGVHGENDDIRVFSFKPMNKVGLGGISKDNNHLAGVVVRLSRHSGNRRRDNAMGSLVGGIPWGEWIRGWQ